MRSRFIIYCTLAVTACHLPRDPAHTLERARGGDLKVGVLDAPPFVEARSPDRDPGGVEPRLVNELAASLGARPRWISGSHHELAEALETRQIDLLIGGLRSDDPLVAHAGKSIPYVEVELVIATHPDEPLSSIAGRAVAVEAGRAAAAEIRKKDGEPVTVERIETAAPPLATEDYRADALGLRRTDIVLAKRKHVLAVAPGENGFLRAVDDFLASRKNEARAMLVAEAKP